MSLKQISIRIEISFWQLVIILLSESRPVQNLITWIYKDFLPAWQHFVLTFDISRAFFWSAIGLALGVLVGILSAIF
jgi:hypothetical protein